MKSERNRSQGWSHAKNSGHKNEDLVENSIRENNPDVKIVNLGKGKVESIMGPKTPSKSDIIVEEDGVKKNISIKKSKAGQIHMNKVKIFLTGYEKIYGEINNDVKDAMLYVFGGNENTKNILSNPLYIHEDEKIRGMEKRRNTLTFDTLKKYDQRLFDILINWFKDNIGTIAELIFSRGWVKDSTIHANVVLYKNLVDGIELDKTFMVNDIIDGSIRNKDMVIPGTENGGTTIQLPFGHIQYHQGGLQFHHSYDKITKIVDL